MWRKLKSLAVLAPALAVLAPAACCAGVEIKQLPDRLRVEIDGRLFTEYFFTNVPRPYCYPLIGPGELPMTRNWPMTNAPGEAHDHPHHRSFWFAHGSVNGFDFWSEQGAYGKTVHDRFLEVRSGKDTGLIKSRNKWITATGQQVCTDERTLRFYSPRQPSQRIVDFDITLLADHGDLTLGDTKEGTMAVRIAETMRLKGNLGKGHILNSEGVRDDQTWGKRAKWCDYYGPVQDSIVGIAIFDHPQNPRHPTWWHVRDYGLFAANPFGQHDFEKLQNKSAGDLTVPAGKSITFRYRFVLHEGGPDKTDLPALYQAYSQSAPEGK